MSNLLGWCTACTSVRSHVVSGQEVACTGCGHVGPVTPGLLPVADQPVVAWELCDYEGVMVPVGHACVGDGTPPCPTEAGEPCGVCPADLAAQEADLKRAEVGYA